tara:strand:+ start:448 stop:657 length:210 start_codon:yes stop_codon:yes gene_type:complete
MAAGYYYYNVYLPNKEIRGMGSAFKPVAAKKIHNFKFTPIINFLQNKMLKVGECTICFGEEKTFKVSRK